MLYISDRKKASNPDNEQYDNDYFKDTLKEGMSGYMDYAKQSRPLRMNFKNLISRIYPHLSPDTSKSVLDVGCAYGFFLDEMRKIGMSVHGLDLSENAIQWMEKELGIKGTVGLSFDAPDGPFDIVTAIEVIEHAPDPHSFLDDLYKRLRKDGLLVIRTGANDTTAARLFGKRWWYLNPPDHCAIFSRFALEKLISDRGFALLEHSIIPFDRVGLNNMFLKLARMFESERLGRLASKLPALVVPVPHYSTQLLIARKR
ncbi:ubiquinone biosynthesis O-methyltransferase [bacterium BMS3Abin06]|nr:ubiquinone biosynthesis O-methyltransferase [bacterium BMS3Abin06]